MKFFIYSVLLLWTCLFANVNAGPNIAEGCQADVILLIDGSGSISPSSFAQMIEFCEDTVDLLKVSDDGAHLGVIQFSSSSTVNLPLTGNASVASATIKLITQMGGSTNTGKGLASTLAEFQSDGRGPTTVPAITILITDGEASSDPIAAAQQLKTYGALIIGIGVGNGADMEQIQAIASQPSSEYVYALQDFSGLTKIINSIVAKACAQVISVSPANGPSTGGTAVIIDGKGFQDNSANPSQMVCRFGDVTTPVLKYINSTSVACRTPEQQGSNADVVVSYAADDISFARSDVIFHYDGGSSGGCPSPDCGGHGVCAGDTCICNSGWSGPNCDEKECPSNCCGHGTCDSSTGTCSCNEGYMGSDCCSETVICCHYCIPDAKNPGHFKPSSYLAECYNSYCPGRYPAELVKSWQVNTTDGLNGCIFNQHPQTNHPCLRDWGYCK